MREEMRRRVNERGDEEESELGVRKDRGSKE